MRCNHCGAESTEDSLYCTQCGKKLSTGSELKSTKRLSVLIILLSAVSILLLIGGGIGWWLYLNKSENTKNQVENIENQDENIYNTWIDLGLPSGTKWKAQNEVGYYTYDEAVSQFGDALPTAEQFDELINKCTWDWRGAGYKGTGPNGNSITLPAAGFRNVLGEVDYVGSDGFYWSSTPNGSKDAWILNFHSGSVYMDFDIRGYGRSVRLVR